MFYQHSQQEAVEKSKNYKRAEGELLDALEKVDNHRVYKQMGYTSLFEYCREALKLSESDTFRFTAVMRKSKAIPELRAAIQSQDISVSMASRITRVITKENSSDWIEKLATLPQRKIEKLVAAEKPREARRDRVRAVAETLSELRATISSDVEAKLERAKDLLAQKLRRDPSIGEVLGVALERFLKEEDPLLQPPSSRKVNPAKVNTGQVRHKSNLGRQVYQEAEGQCRFRLRNGERCKSKRWLDIHHIVPQSLGGKNEVENLTLFCAAHHRMVHDGMEKNRKSG